MKNARQSFSKFLGDVGGSAQTRPTDDAARISELQARIDTLLAGRVQNVVVTRDEEDNRLFASFLSSDQHRASALSVYWMRLAGRGEGLNGLERAVDHMYESLGGYPSGMVEYAVKLFLTHYAPARQQLVMRSLEERQPGMVQPSGALRHENV